MRIPRKVRWPVSVVAGLWLASAAVVSLASPPNALIAEPQVTAAVRGYVDTWAPEQDPLVRLAGGTEVKASNFYGIRVSGTRYYYRLVHGQSFDPKSRGEKGIFLTVGWLDPDTEWETEVYRWTDGPQDSPAH